MHAQQTTELCELLKNLPVGEEETLIVLLRDRIPAKRLSSQGLAATISKSKRNAQVKS
ncbi:MAG: hypothetical protein F6K31_34615 [Symploca sp. SIO2G7]|nr:hypothetical protein [Symploca sp. SIO2G7]